MGARRSPWLDAKAELLVSILADRHGYTVTEDIAREDVSSHIDHVALMMGVGRPTAKSYITDQVISDLADRIAAFVERHQDAIRRGEVADLHARRRFRS